MGKRLPLFGLMLFVAANAWAAGTNLEARKSQLLEKANQAVVESRVNDAATAYCQASALAPQDRETANLCRVFKRSVARMLDLFDEYTVDGITLAANGQFEEALVQFRRVKFGPDKSIADDWINRKIPAMQGVGQNSDPQSNTPTYSLDAASAARKKSLLTEADRSLGQGRLDEATKRYCDASLIDPRDTELAATCKATARDVVKQLERFDQYLADATALANQGKFDDAIAQFRRIKYGPNQSAALEWINVKIPQMKAARQHATKQ